MPSSTPKRTSRIPAPPSSDAFALASSLNFTYPILTWNVEMKVEITGSEVPLLQGWFEKHREGTVDVTPDALTSSSVT